VVINEGEDEGRIGAYRNQIYKQEYSQKISSEFIPWFGSSPGECRNDSCQVGASSCNLPFKERLTYISVKDPCLIQNNRAGIKFFRITR
jgi:hypothetical protein